MFHEFSKNWPAGVHAKYRASPKEWTLHVAFFGLLGIAVGLLVYREQQFLFPLFIGAIALVVFYLLTKEIRRNFRLEEERNRSVFESQVRR